MPNWTRNNDRTFTCSACSVTFAVGGACGCTGVSPAPAAEPDASQALPAAGAGISDPPKRKRGGQPKAVVLSTEDVARRSAEVTYRARDIYRHLARIDLEREPIAEGCPSPGALEITMRRTQLIALDTELKALRLAGAQAEARETRDDDMRIVKAAEALDARDGLAREGVH